MVLIFSDLHLDNYRRFSVTAQNGMNSRLVSQINTVKKVMKVASDLKPEAIVFLGDWFNGQGASINKLLFLQGYNLVEQLSKIAPLYMIVGNHDIYGSSHILSPFSEFENVVVVDEVRHEDLLGMDVAMTPWGGIIPKGGDVLLGHFDITGFKTGLGYELPGTIEPKELKNFKLVVSGHYHSYQEMKPNIVYCGSVMPITFGDTAEEDYGCLLLDSDLNYTRHIITSPKFIPILVDTQADLDRFVENKSTNYYRVTIRDRKVVVPKFDHTVEIEWDIQEEMKSRLQYSVDDSLEDILCMYIDKANTSIDKEQAKQLLREVMKE